MGKKVKTVKKTFRCCTVDYAYINNDMGVSYDTHDLDFFTTSKDLLARQVAFDTGYSGITVLGITEVFKTYEMSAAEFKESAMCTDVAAGNTVSFDKE